MDDRLRSLTVLGMAFVGVLVVTLGLAATIVPNRVASSEGTGDSSPTPAAAHADPGVRGPAGMTTELQVTGDREGTLSLMPTTADGTHSLAGDDGRIVFKGPPVEVTQMSYDGWEFFPDPDECTITPGDLDTSTGIGSAELRCQDITDIRDNGVITITGTIRLPLDLLAERELAHSGGRVAVGEETWEFDLALLSAWETPAIGGPPQYSMSLVAGSSASAVEETMDLSVLNFTYDHTTHELTLANIAREGEAADVPEGACDLGRTDLGRLNPRTTVVELTIDCAQVDVPGLGAVPISGTVVVDELQSPG